MDISTSNVLSFLNLFFSFVLVSGVTVGGIILKRLLKLSDDKSDATDKKIIIIESELKNIRKEFVTDKICKAQSMSCIGNLEKQFNNGMIQFKDIKASLKDLASDITEIKIQNAKCNCNK